MTELKKCPFCAEEVSQNDTKCKHCEEYLVSKDKKYTHSLVEWHGSYRKKSVNYLIVIFLLTSWYNFFLAIFLLPFIFFVKRGRKLAIVSVGVFSGLLIFVNIASYVDSMRNEQGIFASSSLPILIFLCLYIDLLFSLRKAYKEGKKIEIIID